MTPHRHSSRHCLPVSALLQFDLLASRASRARVFYRENRVRASARLLEAAKAAAIRMIREKTKHATNVVVVQQQ